MGIRLGNINAESNWREMEIFRVYRFSVYVAFGFPPIALRACRTMRRFQYDSNCMILFAITCDSDNYQEES